METNPIGCFGKSVNTPFDEFEEDDGISHQVEGGLALVLNYKMNEDKWLGTQIA